MLAADLRLHTQRVKIFSEQKQNGSPTGSILDKVIMYIESSYSSDISLDELVRLSELTPQYLIDGARDNTAENMLYRGSGMVTGNNTSRLLLDYKAQNPKAYNEILEYIFGDKGLCVNHLKIEMGSDINSSSGTEPAVMRYEDEKADVTRGAGYQLAADAKKDKSRSDAGYAPVERTAVDFKRR